MLSLDRAQIETLIDTPVITPVIADAITNAYVAASAGKINLPPVGHIIFPDLSADCHIKYGHQIGTDHFVIKIATGFPLNGVQNLPTGNGMMLVLSAKTGAVEALLHDEMRLTDIRTGIGGAIASRALCADQPRHLLVLGTGPQAACQISAHKQLLPSIENISLWGRDSAKAASLAESLSPLHDIKLPEIDMVDDLPACVNGADIIVTATGATAPIIRSDWVRGGTHITAVGADAPGKQELDTELVARADRLIVDSHSQTTDHGEISHAYRAGLIGDEAITELGTVLAGKAAGRTDAHHITIADLTGIAAQDLAIAKAVLDAHHNMPTTG